MQCTSILSQYKQNAIFLDSKPITLHFNNSNLPLKFKALYFVHSLTEVSRVPYGDIVDLVSYTAGYRCNLDFFKGHTCDSGFSSFDKPIGPNAVFKRYDETSVISTECVGSFFDCVAIWVNQPIPEMRIVKVSTKCSLLISKGSGSNHDAYYTSGSTIAHDSINMTVYFNCPTTAYGKMIANDSHVFPETTYLVPYLEEGYLTRINGAWIPNVNLEVNSHGDHTYGLFSEHSYKYHLDNPVDIRKFSMEQYYSQISYTYTMDEPVLHIESLPACRPPALAWEAAYFAEDHTQGYFVWAGSKNQTLLPLNCTITCFSNEDRREFIMHNGLASIHLSGEVLCVYGLDGRKKKLMKSGIKHFSSVEPQMDEIMDKAASGTIIQDVAELVQEAGNFTYKLFVVVIIIYVLGPKYPIHALVIAFAIWKFNLVTAMSIHPGNIEGYGKTYFLVVHLCNLWKSTVASIMLTSFTALFLFVYTRNKSHLLTAILTSFAFFDKHPIIILMPSIFYFFDTYFIYLLETAEEATDSMMTRGNLYVTEMWSRLLLGSMVNKSPQYFANPIRYIKMKILQSIYMSSKPMRKKRFLTGRKHNVRNMEGIFFYEEEFQLISHILIKLTQQEISYIYRSALTLAHREPFDMHFLGKTGIRNKMIVEILRVMRQPP